MKKTIFLLFIFFLISTGVSAGDLSTKLRGEILLQVESNGEAWYVSPLSGKRLFLGRPLDAFTMMREQGLGISNKDLYRIPIAVLSTKKSDMDGDGLDDSLEEVLGLDAGKWDSDGDGYGDGQEIKNNFSPWGRGRQNIDMDFASRQSGKIFLQVERKGEAWYVDTENYNRYYLGRPDDAFRVMRELGQGISNKDLNSIMIQEGYDIPKYIPKKGEPEMPVSEFSAKDNGIEYHIGDDLQKENEEYIEKDSTNETAGPGEEKMILIKTLMKSSQEVLSRFQTMKDLNRVTKYPVQVIQC